MGNRDIKFRCWDGERMFENIGLTPIEVIVYDFHNGKMIPPTEDWRFGRDTVNIMQFTGLKDKNNKDIYEGDVMRKHTPYNEEWDTKFTYYKVSFGIINDRMQWFLHRFSTLPYVGNFNELEVVGNIYENPNLL